jgi:hypothetical protein
MRFGPVTSADTRAALLDHAPREFLTRQQTRTVKSVRVPLREQSWPRTR